MRWELARAVQRPRTRSRAAVPVRHAIHAASPSLVFNVSDLLLDNRDILGIVKDLNEQEGVTFLLAEQNTNVALRYADYGYILESGRVVMDGKADALLSNEDVKEFYLGLSTEGRKNFREVKHYKRRKRWL